jgi:hypothetical protein
MLAPHEVDPKVGRAMIYFIRAQAIAKRVYRMQDSYGAAHGWLIHGLGSIR